MCCVLAPLRYKRDPWTPTTLRAWVEGLGLTVARVDSRDAWLFAWVEGYEDRQGPQAWWPGSRGLMVRFTPPTAERSP